MLFLFLNLLIFAVFLVKDKEKRLLFLILLAFNPAMLSYTLEGRSDIFMFTFLFMGLLLLYKKHYLLAGIPIALAFATKQSAWLILPFYIAFLYFRVLDFGTHHLVHPFARTVKILIPFIVTFSIIVLPFFLWDQKAFIDSTIFYLSGNVEHSYPISGYGLGSLLYQLGFIKDVHQYYPFQIWQIIIGLPVITTLIWYLKKHPTVSRLVVVYGVSLFIFWYLSRYFNNSHLGYLTMVFITAYFWPENEKFEKEYKR